MTGLATLGQWLTDAAIIVGGGAVLAAWVFWRGGRR